MKINKLNYVDEAERVIERLAQNAKKDKLGHPMFLLTTSKIRNLLSMVSELQTDAQHCSGSELDEELISRVQYLKMRIAYEEKKKKAVMEFVRSADLLNQAAAIGKDRQQLIVFCNYMEALVAYHKYYGGKD